MVILVASMCSMPFAMVIVTSTPGPLYFMVPSLPILMRVRPSGPSLVISPGLAVASAAV